MLNKRTFYDTMLGELTVQQAYHPDFGQRVNYDIRALPGSADGQVRSTINQIVGYMRTDACSPFIQEEAQNMLALGNGDPNKSVWNLLKPSMKFKRDEAIAEDLDVVDERKRDTIEVLIRPLDQWLLIKLRGLGIGDCDCFHMYAGCLLLALGVPCSLVTVAADAERPWEFSHVYLASYWNGVRMPLDISHGDYPGWEAPNLGRVKEWPCHVTRGEQMFDGLIVIGSLVGAYVGLKWFESRRAA
jgi:hypothetical protein